MKNCLKNSIKCAQSQIILWIDELLTGKKLVSKNENQPKKKLGIIRVGGGLGDWVLLQPLLVELNRFYPKTEWEIIAIVDKSWQVLAEKDPKIDSVIVIDIKQFSRDFFYRIKNLKQLRSLGFEIAINAVLFRHLKRNDALVQAIRAQKSVSFMPQDDQPCEQRLGNKFYSHLVLDNKWNEHESSRVLRLLRQSLQPNSYYCLPDLKWLFPQATIKKPYFIVSPGASFATRRWDINRFAVIAKYIYKKTGFTPIVTGLASESIIMEELIAISKELPWKKILNNSSLLDYLVLVNEAKLLICNDSGGMHVGPALATTTLAICIGAEFVAYPHYPQNNPYLHLVHSRKTDCFNCRWHCTRDLKKDKSAPCIDDVSIDDVQIVIDKITPTI